MSSLVVFQSEVVAVVEVVAGYVVVLKAVSVGI